MIIEFNNVVIIILFLSNYLFDLWNYVIFFIDQFVMWNIIFTACAFVNEESLIVIRSYMRKLYCIFR